MKQYKISKHKGFTLIETVVSIALIALVTVGFYAVITSAMNIEKKATQRNNHTYLTMKGLDTLGLTPDNGNGNGNGIVVEAYTNKILTMTFSSTTTANKEEKSTYTLTYGRVYINLKDDKLVPKGTPSSEQKETEFFRVKNINIK